ncbi:conserved Plasmodium protein, unknown function [Plasmodium knowlesi strain H]|uniref:Uncharacterized protein n=3 Tax=Plasmodium knowlesi TaxID=5850 RepID=A0A5K1UH36_PLAKH|nr:conserved Plasmodium protein, unknown function [Plasmodium knowlesi strain H]OTN64871.1 Uncharacterized protein PKNOH_S120158800 [Plasmodium knowlesi]CAA9988444.1 conserved Plasmodium protein, unknown function [Plasmodium knowlesi strain H]SBO19847.1 conserved Plasmodium protein, unknown function [Plasmodium knowlesi strain H]SBO20436.1 conserved Plasmodium protein, unknown function [Plasmodium knowlesi strain H]VVS77918.1 conserved Plasmodium protein, unknown function [Plasmodium knowlesi |eukprot:XP_002259425.1 hypothetical protein, conserved in Plasmodium species [Plasmodium knowlesi strain H]
MSTWINKKLLSISEKVIENVIDSIANKNTPIDNLQNMQGTQLGKIISKVISSKYFFKNDDICYNSRNLDFNWNMKSIAKRRKKRIRKDKEKRMKQRTPDGRRSKRGSNRRRVHGHSTQEEKEGDCKKDSYNNIYINSKSSNYLNIDESYIRTSSPLNINKKGEGDHHEKEAWLKKEPITCNSSVQSIVSEAPHGVMSLNSNSASNYDSCAEYTTDGSRGSPKRISHDTSGSSSGRTSSRSSHESVKKENSDDASLNLSTSESVSSEAIESSSRGSSKKITSSSEVAERESSLNSNQYAEARENYMMQKQAHLCKVNLFIKEAKLLFFNKNVNISDISIFVTTIMEDKKYVGKLRKLSSRTLPMNNLIINECIKHNVKDIYTDIVINIKYVNKKKNNEEIILGRVIIPFFLLLNTYRYKIKRIRNRIKYCTKCFLWLHIFPCNNKLFNYKFFKPVEGFEEYGMLNPLYTLGFLNIKMKIIFKKNPLLLTLYSNMRKPLFYYKLPVQFEPLYCQYYSENFFVYVTQLPIWLYKFFYLFNPRRVEMIALNYYDYVFILSFWLFFFRLIVISPFFLIFVHIFFCLIFISLSYKFGHIDSDPSIMAYNFRPVHVKKRPPHWNPLHAKSPQPHQILPPENRRNVRFFDSNRREVFLSANDIDSNYCGGERGINVQHEDAPSHRGGRQLHLQSNSLAEKLQGGVNSSDIPQLVVTDDKLKNNPSVHADGREHTKSGTPEKNDELNGEIIREMNSQNEYSSNGSFYGESFISPESPPKDGGQHVAHFQIEENCFVKQSNLNHEEEVSNGNMKDGKNEHPEEQKKKGLIEFMQNTPDELNNKLNNVTKFAKKIQNMMFDSRDKNPLDFFNVGSHGNGLAGLFNGMNEKRRKAEGETTPRGEGQNEKVGDLHHWGDTPTKGKQGRNPQMDDSVRGNHQPGEGNQSGGSNKPSDNEHKQFSTSKHGKESARRTHRGNKNGMEQSIQGEVHTDNSAIDSSSCQNATDEYLAQYKTEVNADGVANSNGLEPPKVVNRSCMTRSSDAIPSFDHMRVVEESPCSNSNTSIESKFLKKNFLFDAIKNNLASPNEEKAAELNTKNGTSGTNEKKDMFAFKKKYAFMPIVKSPFHNFYLFFNSIEGKKTSIFSNNVDVPNVHLLLKRFIMLITLTQNFTGAFTMVYEKVNYALNWEFTSYTFVNMIILFFLSYGISFILYAMSFVPLLFYRFLLFFVISVLLIRSYELTEVGHRASLYYERTHRKKTPWWRSAWRLLTRMGRRVVKAKRKRDAQEEMEHDQSALPYFVRRFFRSVYRAIRRWIRRFVRNTICKFFKITLKQVYKISCRGVVYIYFLIFFLKNWVTRLLILKDIEHMKIAKMQGFKNLFFFIHNRMMRRDPGMKLFLRSNETCPSSGHNRGGDSIGGTPKRLDIMKDPSNEDKPNKNFIHTHMYDNYKNAESCIYSSSDKDALSVRNGGYDAERFAYDGDDEDRESLSQLTDNGTMNVNVDIFLHYYFKRKKYDHFNNIININRNHLYSYKDINLLHSNDDQNISHLNYAEYLNSENNYSSSYDNNKKKRS